jgi:NADH-quinone oxidoreductase subunit I
VPHQRQNFLGGFKLTLEHLGRPPVTRQYPEEKKPKQPRQHGRHVLNRYEDGMEKCIGCELCAGVCPADCIYVRGLDNPPDHPVSPGERYGYVYEINFLRCIHCDLCVEACPTEAITESKLMEFSFTNRNDAIYTKEELLVDDDGKPKHHALGGLARRGRPAHLGLDAGHLAGGECRVRGTRPVVGRAGLRCAHP